MPRETTATVVSKNTGATDLLLEMAEVSRTRFDGDWPAGIEITLWNVAKARDTEQGRRMFDLAQAAGGWWIWSYADFQMQFVELRDWLWFVHSSREEPSA